MEYYQKKVISEFKKIIPQVNLNTFSRLKLHINTHRVISNWTPYHKSNYKAASCCVSSCNLSQSCPKLSVTHIFRGPQCWWNDPLLSADTLPILPGWSPGSRRNGYLQSGLGRLGPWLVYWRATGGFPRFLSDRRKFSTPPGIGFFSRGNIGVWRNICKRESVNNWSRFLIFGMRNIYLKL